MEPNPYTHPIKRRVIVEITDHPEGHGIDFRLGQVEYGIVCADPEFTDTVMIHLDDEENRFMSSEDISLETDEGRLIHAIGRLLMAAPEVKE